MLHLSHILKISKHTTVEQEVLNELFEMERSTLVTTILLETILLYILVPFLGNGIFAWYGVIISISLWRLYNAYDFRTNPGRNSEIVWHEKFVVQVWSTALLFSVLALFAIPNLDKYYQLFVFMVLLGTSTSAVKALGSDHRTALGYVTILILPVFVEMLLLQRQDMYILAFLVILYYAIQAEIILSSYSMSLQAKRAQQEAQRVKEALYEKHEIMRSFFEQADEALFMYDKSLRLLDFNIAFEKLLNLPKAELLHHAIDTLPNAALNKLISQTLANEDHQYIGSYKRDTNEIWLDIRCVPVYKQNGEEAGGIGLIKDKTVEHTKEQELAHMALHDSLTGLSNRRGFREYMKRLFGDLRHRQYSSLLLYLDIDNFKSINDQYGHDTGDKVLQEISKRLRDTFGSDANLTRLGGDEFCIVVPFVDDNQERRDTISTQWLENTAQNINKVLTIGTNTVDVTCSIGVEFVEPGETDLDQIVSRADLNMMRAKRQYSKHPDRHQIDKTLAATAQSWCFELSYQPIYDQGTVVAARSVTRWLNIHNGNVSDAIPLPKRCAYESDIDLAVWKLTKVIRQIQSWQNNTHSIGIKYVIIPISQATATNSKFVDQALHLIGSHGVSGDLIALELDTLDTTQLPNKSIDLLKNAGIRILQNASQNP